MTKQLTFVIHHLNPWGGHDRSTLEIVRRISRRKSIEIQAFELNDPDLNKPGRWGTYNFVPITPHFRRPTIILLIVFFVKTFFSLRKNRALRLIHSTGACSLISDVIQVQFVQATWKKTQNALNTSIYNTPRTRSAIGIKKMILNGYHQVLLNFNVWLEHRIFHPSKQYIAISNGIANELQTEFQIPKSQITVIRHGVDCEKFCPPSSPDPSRRSIREEHGIDSTDVVLLFVGEYERKGLSISLETLSKLKSRGFKSLKLLVVGDGDTQGFRAKSVELGIASQVVFLEPKKDIERYYRAADLFLLPTLYEPFGLVILEAMASGLPCIVSHTAGAAELIDHGKNGLLINHPTDSEEIANLVAIACGNSDLRKELGIKARLTAEGQTWDRVAERYEQLLFPLLRATTTTL